MGRVHDVLRWANRRDVAREVTKRGYRVSGETLNRWVRDEQEFPAVVERIVFDLFTISGHEETPPPGWAEAVADKVVERLSGISARELADVEAMRPELDAARAARQPDEVRPTEGIGTRDEG